MGNISNQPAGKKEVLAERRIKALELRQSGMPYRKIAALLGVSEGQAHNYVKQSLEALASQEIKEAETLRQLELENLNRMQEALWEKGISGAPGSEWIIDRLLRISESRRKLYGLDSPIKTELTGPEGGKLEILVTYENVSIEQ